MGKASKWFRGLLGLKKHDPSSSSITTQHPNTSTTSTTTTKPTKKRWSFVKSYREKDSSFNNSSNNSKASGSRYGVSRQNDSVDTTKRAIEVAEATAVVAEAAIAAAQAAAAVVKLTSSGRATTTTTRNNSNSGGDGGGGEVVMRWNGVNVGSSAASMAVVGRRGGGFSGDSDEWAAVVIQSHFRGYLSRRALRALKGLVKLQALVRGHLVRQQTADYLRQMQAIIRAQSRARTGRSQVSGSPNSSSKSVQFRNASPTTPEKFEHVTRARSLKHDEMSMLKSNTSKSNRKVTDLEKARIGPQGSSARTRSIDDEKSDKILEIDVGKPYCTPKRRNLFHSSHLSLNSDSYSLTTSKESTAHQTVPSPSSCGNQSQSPLKFIEDLEEPIFCTADNSPQFYSASSKGGGSKKGPFTPTKSDVGSISCLSGYSDHPNYMSYTESAKAKVRSMSAPKQRPHYERSSSTKRYSIHGYGESRTISHKGSFYTSFTGKAYPGSGRLDQLGMPVVRADPSGFSGGLRHRY